MKNKKLLIFSLIMVVVLSLGLVACSDGSPKVTYGEWKIVSVPTDTTEGKITREGSDGKVYTFTLPVLTSENYTKSEVLPTCEADGKVTYTIKAVDKNYSFDITVPKLNHDWNEPTYEWSTDYSTCTATRVCSRDNTHTESATATITSKVTQEPTFTAMGKTKYTATFVEDWANGTEPITVEVANIPMYKLSRVPATVATVNSKGNIEYWAGTNGKYYSDDSHTTEITLESTVIPKVAVTKVDKINPQYGVAGQKEYYYETANKANKYYLVDGTYTAIPSDKDLVIPELLGTITIYVNGAKQDKIISHKKSEEVTLDAINAIVGTGAYTGLNYYEDSAKTTPIANIKTYAEETQNVSVHVYMTYTITFDVKNGSAVESVIREYGSTYGTLVTPDKAGYTFDGWYTDEEKFITSTTPIEHKAHTLHANWYTEGLSIDKGVVIEYTGTSTKVEVPKYCQGTLIIAVEDYAFATINFTTLEVIPSKVSITDITLPDAVEYIGDGAFAGNAITNIMLPKNLVIIGELAFSYCVDLQSVVLPASVEVIADFAFGEALKLESVTFAEGSAIEYLGDGAFAYCESLKSLEIPSCVQYIGSVLLSNHAALTSLTIKDIEGVTPLYTSRDTGGETNTIMYIGEEMLPRHEVAGIEGGTLPIPDIYTNTVIIGAGQGVRIPDTAKTISSWAFGGANLGTISIPANVTKIEDYALENAGLTSVDFAVDTEPLTIGDNAFAYNDIETIFIPERVIYMGANVFNGCELLTKIYLYHHVMPTHGENWNSNKNVYLYSADTPTLEDWTAHDTYWYELNGEPTLYESPRFRITYENLMGATNGNATSFKLNGPSIGLSGLSNLDHYVFNGWYSDKDLTKPIFEIPTNVAEDVTVYASWFSKGLTFFYTDGNLTIDDFMYSGGDLIIPGVYTNEMGMTATLADISNINISSLTLNKIVIGEGVKSIGESVLSAATQVDSVYLPSTIERIGYDTFAGTPINNIYVDERNTRYTSGANNDMLMYIGDEAVVSNDGKYTYDKNDIIVFRPGSTIPAEADAFGPCAARNIAGFSNINIPANIKTIKFGGLAFIDAPSIIWADTEGAEIHQGALSNNSALTEVKLPLGLVSIDSEAFAATPALDVLIIPLSVETMGSNVFSEVKLILLEHSEIPVGFAKDFGANISLYLYNDKDDYIYIEESDANPIFAWKYNENGDPMQVAFMALRQDGDAYMVMGYEGYLTELTIDGYYNNKVIKGITQGAFEGNTQLQKITLGRDVYTIKGRAFADCSALSEIIWYCRESLDIANDAFDGSANITKVYGSEDILPALSIVDKVTHIHFIDDVNTVNIDMSKWTSLKNIHFDASTEYISSSTCSDWAMLDSLTVDEHNRCYIAEAGSLIMKGYYNMLTPNKTNTIPESALDINDGVFSKANIVNMVVPNHITSLQGAFAGNTTLETITLPASLNYVALDAFVGCTSLTSININKTKADVDATWEAGWNNGVDANKIHYLDAVSTSGDYEYIVDNNEVFITAYKGAGGVVVIPDTIDGKKVVSIGKAFNGNTNVTSLTLGANILRVSDEAFMNCTVLKSIDFKNVKNISATACMSCAELESVNVLNAEIIECAAFANCAKLSTLELGDRLVSFNLDSIVGTKVTSLVIPKSVKSFISEESPTQLESLVFEAGGTITALDRTTFSGLTALTTLVLPDSLVAIDEVFFDGTTKIQSLTLPASLERINTKSLLNITELKEIKVAEGSKFYTSRDSEGRETNVLKYIGSECMLFEYDMYLSIVICPGDVVFMPVYKPLPKGYDVIGPCLYYECTESEIVLPSHIKGIRGEAFNGAAATNIVLNEGLEFIEWSAFYKCANITCLTIPSTVKSIGSFILTGCTACNEIVMRGDIQDVHQEMLNKDTISIYFTSEPTSDMLANAGIVKAANRYLYSETKPTVLPEGKIDGFWHYTDDTKTTKEVWEDAYMRGLSFAKVAGGNDYEVVGYSGTATHLDIPSAYTDGAVVGIKANAEGLANLESITSIKIPSSITYIGDGAFNSCPNLANIDMSEATALESIGVGAFSMCKLVSVHIPANVNSIGDTAFGFNPTLASITVEPTNTTCQANGTVLVVGGKIVLGITANPVIPEDATAIASYAFAGNTGLTDIVLPANIESIGEFAYTGCSNITSIKVASGSRLTTLGNAVFGGLPLLTTAVIPASVNSIGADIPIFTGSLKVKIYYEGTTALDPAIFRDGWNTVDSKDGGTTKAPIYIFSPEAPTALRLEGTEGYWHYSDVSTMTIALWDTDEDTSGLTFASINEGTAFAVTGYTGASKVVNVPNTYLHLPVTEIAQSAFNNSRITSITFGENVRKINSNAFLYAERLTSVNLQGIVEICSSAFAYSGITSLSIPNTVTTIRLDAFVGCPALKSLTIEDGTTLTTIESGAFKGAALTTVVMAKELTAIGTSMFYDCTALNSVTFKTGSALSTIYRHAFKGCTALTSIALPEGVNIMGDAFRESGLTSFNITANTTIGDEVFRNCANLQTVTIEAGVNSIDRSCFDGCSNITSITYNGDVASWNDVTRIGTSNAVLPEVTCNDGNGTF